MILSGLCDHDRAVALRHLRVQCAFKSKMKVCTSIYGLYLMIYVCYSLLVLSLTALDWFKVSRPHAVVDVSND